MKAVFPIEDVTPLSMKHVCSNDVAISGKA